MPRSLNVTRRRRPRRGYLVSALLTSLVLMTTSPELTEALAVKKEQQKPKIADRHHPNINDTLPDFENTIDLKHDAKSGGGTVVTLGELIGLFCLICGILYCIGIGWKIVKVWKGTYVPQEPVFLKYK